MSKTFTVFSGSDERPNRLEMRRAHFDAGELPAKHRNAPEGLFPVADVARPKAPKVSRPEPQIDGQADLFSESDG